MAKIEKSIDVNVPVRQAYNQWTQFESFPQFMDGVESVTQQGDTNLHWIAEIAGKRQEWDAEITEQTPDQRIAWTSTTGDRNAGAVDFHRVADEQTRITLTMDIEPSGALEKVGTALGIPSGQVEGDLKKFKDFIESRGSATGAWRGQVEQNDVAGSGLAGGAGSGSSMADSSFEGGSTSDRELAGAGSMGSIGSAGTLGTDYSTTTTSDPYATDTGTTTGSTGTGDMGSGLNNPQDLGTGRRENETGF